MNKFRSMTAVMAMVFAVGSFSAPARAESFLEKLFPFLFEEPHTGPKPEDTLQAPFIEKGAVDTTESQQIGVEYKPETALESGVSLDQAHRQPVQLLDWSSKVISDSLDFDPLRYDQHLVSLQTQMTPYAIEAFKAFLAKDNLLAALTSNGLVMRAFVTDPARLLNQGAVQGRYRWLVETPVTITFLPRGTMDYAGLQPKSQIINVRTQLGRVAEGGVDGVMIETMEFIPVAAKK